MVVTAIDLVARYLSEKEVFDRSSHQGIEDFDDAVALSYLLLRADQLTTTGLWGRTISKNVLLNYPNDPKVTERLTELRSIGSVTHAAFALRGLHALQQATGHVPSVASIPAMARLMQMQTANGVFHPSPSEFTGGSGGEYRHNTTALIMLAYLATLDGRRSVRRTAELWASESFREFLKLPSSEVLFCDKRYETTLLYLIWCLNIYRSNSELPEVWIPPHGSKFWAGVASLLENYYAEGLFFDTTHRSTCYYYTLIALEILLGIEGFLDDPEREALVWQSLRRIASARGENKGVPLGYHARTKCFSFQDVGTTARFHNVVALYLRNVSGASEERISDASTMQKESMNFVRKAFLSVRYGNYNAMTHSYEAVLSMAEFIPCTNRDRLISLLKRIDTIVDSWSNDGRVRLADIRALDIPHRKFATLMTRRDIVLDPQTHRLSCWKLGCWIRK